MGKPWNAEHAAGRITQPLRFNGQPYSGINILSLWMSASAQGFAAPIWMTFRQAIELNAHVRKGEKGSLVVYANTITRTEHDEKTGEDIEREIPYLKGYTVFNVEQIDGLPELYYAKAAPQLDPVARIDHAEKFFAAVKATIRHGGNRAYYAQELDDVQMPPFECFRDAESYYSTLAHEMTHWTKHPPASPAISAASSGATTPTRRKNSLPSWVLRSFAPIWNWRPSRARRMPPT